MSFDIQSALTQQRLNDYGSLVVVAAVSYDYCLTISKEVNYIWRRPWTRVSMYFLLVRYVGCLSILSFGLTGSSFIPDTWNHVRRNIFTHITIWTRVVFIASADLVMVLRVYAMYNRSRIILSFLLALYATEIITFLIVSAIYSSPVYAVVSTVQLLDVTICNLVLSTSKWNTLATIFQFVFGSAVCLLVIAKFARESFEIYRATQTWQLNKYMNLLARDGVFYIIVSLLYSLLTMLDLMGVTPQEGWVAEGLAILGSVPLYTMTPRFIINVRELYVRDASGRLDRDIDLGFGLSSQQGDTGVGELTTIAFVDGDHVGLGNGELMTIVWEGPGQRRRAESSDDG